MCAGAGGLSLGLQRAGFSVLGVEHERHAHRAHLANVGPCDLADLHGWHPPGPVDLVAGGVPCQPWSSQGKRLGLREAVGRLFPDMVEPRAVLWRQWLRIAIEADARAVLLENVPGLESWDDGDALQDWSAAERFAWPEPTHGPGRAHPWRTVRDALLLGPGPFLAGERNGSGWQGHRAIDVDAPIGTRGNPDLLVPILGDALAAAGVLDRPATTIAAGGGGRLARKGGSPGPRSRRTPTA